MCCRDIWIKNDKYISGNQLQKCVDKSLIHQKCLHALCEIHKHNKEKCDNLLNSVVTVVYGQSFSRNMVN